MSSIDFQLPWPPSVNHAWRPTAAGGKILSEDYVRFKKAVGDRVLEKRIKRFWTKDRLAVALTLKPPNMRDYDIDNRAKCCIDAIAAAGVIENDKYIDLLLIVRGKLDAPHGSVMVRIEEMSLPNFSALGDFRDYFCSRAYDAVDLQPSRTAK
jgi:Holliday junction resolvase RusA-like endonuclease